MRPHPVPLGFVFRSRSKEEKAPAAQATGDRLQQPRDPQAPKGRPTPKRALAQTQRRSVTNTPTTRKEAAKRQRDERRTQMAKQREAMASGDERYLPARDKGPVRKFARDFVDSRFCIAEYFLPLAVIILVLSIVRIPQLQNIALLLWLVVIVLIVRRLGRHRVPAQEAARRALPEREPEGRRRVRPDAYAPDAPAAAAEAAGQARRAALSGGSGRGRGLAGELGGLRNAVRQELVARQLDEQIVGRFPVGQRLRILDVGMGQGTQALRLARAGHRVTGWSPTRDARAARTRWPAEPDGIQERVRLMEGDGRETGVHFLPGSFDVVLCHGVLMYVADPDPLLGGLARMLAPGGLLSLLVRNAEALAMRPGLAGDWAGAIAAFDSLAYTNRLGLRRPRGPASTR